MNDDGAPRLGLALVEAAWALHDDGGSLTRDEWCALMEAAQQRIGVAVPSETIRSIFCTASLHSEQCGSAEPVVDVRKALGAPSRRKSEAPEPYAYDPT